MGFFSESKIDENNVGEWVAWGGITRPTVMRQRGGSFFSVISYAPYRKGISLEFPDFRRGWVVTNEHQHIPAMGDKAESAKDYLVILWNPFVSIGNAWIENPLDLGDGIRRVAQGKAIDYFVHVVGKLREELSKSTEARILEYQELMDFISFSVSLGDDHVEMPDIPLYMDYLLTQNNTFEFGGNSIRINGKRVFVVSMADILDTGTLYQLFLNLPFRHVRRVLCFDREETRAEMKKYAGSWCPSRRAMRSYLFQNIQQDFNGYYHEGFYFHLLPEQADFPAYLRKRLNDAGLFYRFESFNLKDIWWGSLPGNFLANVVPPTTGFASLEDILCHPLDHEQVEARKQFDEELIASLKRKHIADGEGSGATFETEEQLQRQKEGLEYVQD